MQGALTDKIEIQRSVRQGCPISMIFFIIAQEGLGELIRRNRKGYTLSTGKALKVLSYADDNTFIVTDMSSIEPIMDDIRTYCHASRAKLNKDKTTWKVAKQKLQRSPQLDKTRGKNSWANI